MIVSPLVFRAVCTSEWISKESERVESKKVIEVMSHYFNRTFNLEINT